MTRVRIEGGRRSHSFINHEHLKALIADNQQYKECRYGVLEGDNAPEFDLIFGNHLFYDSILLTKGLLKIFLGDFYNVKCLNVDQQIRNYHYIP